MRELKFMVWDTKLKEMYLPSISEVSLDCEGLIYLYGEFRPEYQERFIFLQFTGFHDKNDREIYEGNIIKDKHGIKWKVIFEMGKFSAFCNTESIIEEINVRKDKDLTFEEEVIEKLDMWWIGSEVIGNIYENPKLLEEAEK